MLSMDPKLSTSREAVAEENNQLREFWEIVVFKNIRNFQENTATEPFF